MSLISNPQCSICKRALGGLRAILSKGIGIIIGGIALTSGLLVTARFVYLHLLVQVLSLFCRCWLRKLINYDLPLQEFHCGMDTNNFTESLNRVLKSMFFSPRPDRRLDSLLDSICTEALPYFQTKYIEENKK